MPEQFSASHYEKLHALLPEATLVSAEERQRDVALWSTLDVLFTQPVDTALIARARHLQWVQTWGAGVEWLLTPEVMKREELRITNASGIHAQPIAEHVFGFLLMHVRALHLARDMQQQGDWQGRARASQVSTLEGSTLGILGVGAIGERIAQLGKSFGMHVTGWRRSDGAVPCVDRMFRPDELHAFLASADFLVNALPHTSATHHLLDADAFAAMRRRPFLVNIGRGATIQQEALHLALRSGQLRGAGLDVTDPEPLPREHPLWREPNVIITPHYSGAHPAYADRVASIFLDNVVRFSRGEPLVNLVDKVLGY